MKRAGITNMIYTIITGCFLCLGISTENLMGQDVKKSIKQDLKETKDRKLVFTADKQKVDELVKDWPGTSREAAETMISKYGHPDEATNSMLVWNNNGIWKQTIVYRNEVQHNFPVPHHDVLEQVVNFNVPLVKVKDLLAFDGSIHIDRTKGELAVRCDQEGMNFLALNLAYDIIMGNKTVDEARSFYTRTTKLLIKGEEPDYAQKLHFVPEKITGYKDDVQVNEIIENN